MPIYEKSCACLPKKFNGNAACQLVAPLRAWLISPNGATSGKIHLCFSSIDCKPAFKTQPKAVEESSPGGEKNASAAGYRAGAPAGSLQFAPGSRS